MLQHWITMIHVRGRALAGTSGLPSRRRLRWWTGVATALLLGSLSDPARASEWGGEGSVAPEPASSSAAPAPARGSGWLPGAALHTPLSLALLSEDDIPQATLLMGGVDLDLSLGRRIGSSSRLAYELALGLRGMLSVVELSQIPPGEPTPPDPIEGYLSYVLPLGLCIDWLPESPSGWLASAHLGVGTFSPPEFMNSGNIDLAGRVALDLGWQLPLPSGSLGLSARYSLLGLQRIYIDEEYNSTLVSHELSFGVSLLLP